MKFKRIRTLLLSELALIALLGFTTVEYPSSLQMGNTLLFGGKAVQVDMVDCSTDNSNDGKSRAIAAINTSTNSMLTIQFGTVDPAAGIYTTTSEEPIGPNQVIVGAAGSSFGDGFVATAGQTITVTTTGTNYGATFKDIIVADAISKKSLSTKITGILACE